MKREERYIVIKCKDFERAIETGFLDQHDLEILMEIINGISQCRASENKIPLQAAIVESDWPEYEKVWEMIEERVGNESSN